MKVFGHMGDQMSVMKTKEEGDDVDADIRGLVTGSSNTEMGKSDGEVPIS